MIDKNESEIKKKWTNEEVPLVTVAVIAYNHGNYIAESLDGILMQKTDFPFEIVAYDDFSTDNTADILKEYAKKYPTIIRLMLQKENLYSQDVRVEIIVFENSLGKYIATNDGDDYWIDPHKLQIQLDEMRKIENCQLSFHSAIDKWEDKSKRDGVTTKQANGNKLFTTSEIIAGGGEFCPTASVIVAKEVVEDLPEWVRKAPYVDYFVQILGSVKGGALYIDRPMSVYRVNRIGSWTSMAFDLKKKEEEFKKIIITMDDMDRCFDQQFHREITEIKSDFYLRYAYVCLYNNEFEKFNQAVGKSYHLSEKKSKKLLLSFYLRKSPVLLQGMGWLYKRLNKFLASIG